MVYIDVYCIMYSNGFSCVFQEQIVCRAILCPLRTANPRTIESDQVVGFLVGILDLVSMG